MTDSVRKLHPKFSGREVLKRLMPSHEAENHALVLVTYDGFTFAFGCSCGASEAYPRSVVETLCGLNRKVFLQRMEDLNYYVDVAKLAKENP